MKKRLLELLLGEGRFTAELYKEALKKGDIKTLTAAGKEPVPTPTLAKVRRRGGYRPASPGKPSGVTQPTPAPKPTLASAFPGLAAAKEGFMGWGKKPK